MKFFRIVGAFAAVATLLQLVLVTLVAANYLTLDGNWLRGVAFAVGVVAALLLPLGGSAALIRSLEIRGRKPRRGPLFAGLVALFNGVALTGLFYLLPSPTTAVWSGGSRLVTLQAAAPTDPTAPSAPAAAEPSSPATAQSNAVEASRQALKSVLSADDKLSASLTDESAAALGALWMGFLTETFGDSLQQAAGPELWASVHQGLPDQPGLWADPAALEAPLTARGRGFLADVVELADAAADGSGTGPMAWPILPSAVLSATVQGGSDVAWKAEYTEVAMNRVEVRIVEQRWDVRYEDHGWRVHLGDFGDLATRRIAPTTMLIALHP